ncbi:hypothetical protein M231_05629 [Tremella mesenterica]|uniref:Uncharacterized protein n=1 Tax=Tremella mesenterica TaxID=5217 RepID=A0A4Q1BHM7_TREME|nr:hypothetical protein M231_05629 [Tremella mesenterica]
MTRISLEGDDDESVMVLSDDEPDRHDQLRESKARCTHLELELESCKSDNVKYVTAFDKLVSVLLDDNGKNVHDPDNLQDVVLLILSRFHNVSKAVDGVREQMLAEHETVGHVRSQNRTLQSRLERMQEQVERLEDTLKVKVELEEKLDMMAGTLDGYKDHLKALQIQVQVAKSLEREATRREVEVEKSNKYLKEGMEDLGKCTEHLIKRFLVLHGQSVGLVVERQRQVTGGVVSSVDDHTRKQKQKTKMSVELLWDSKILGKAISKLSERRATTTLKAQHVRGIVARLIANGLGPQVFLQPKGKEFMERCDGILRMMSLEPDDVGLRAAVQRVFTDDKLETLREGSSKVSGTWE